MTIPTSITRRERTRTLTSGTVVVHTRFVLNYRCLRSGKRRQLFVRSQRDAIAKRDGKYRIPRPKRAHLQDAAGPSGQETLEPSPKEARRHCYIRWA